MCRSIKQLRRPDLPVTDEEIEAAALQFVRKVGGYRKPSQANEEAFNKAITEISASTRVLLHSLVVRQTTKSTRFHLNSTQPLSLTSFMV